RLRLVPPLCRRLLPGVRPALPISARRLLSRRPVACRPAAGPLAGGCRVACHALPTGGERPLDGCLLGAGDLGDLRRDRNHHVSRLSRVVRPPADCARPARADRGAVRRLSHRPLHWGASAQTPRRGLTPPRRPPRVNSTFSFFCMRPSITAC